MKESAGGPMEAGTMGDGSQPQTNTPYSGFPSQCINSEEQVPKINGTAPGHR